jgi:hypothetical protein
MDVSTTIIGSGQADITAKENACMVALSQPYQDFILKQDSGADSGTRLINRTSLSGVMLTEGPNFKTAGRGEYVNQRTVEFTVEAEYIFPGAQSLILSWEESITVRGNGGPSYVWRFPFNAPAEVQQVTLQSLITTVQRGRGVGHTRYPTAAAPFAGRPAGIFVNDTETVVRGSPKSIGRGWVEYPIEWSYEYRSPAPVVGTPSLPPLA